MLSVKMGLLVCEKLPIQKSSIMANQRFTAQGRKLFKRRIGSWESGDKESMAFTS